MGVFGIDHVAFRTPDPAWLREFYAELRAAIVPQRREPLLAGGST